MSVFNDTITALTGTVPPLHQAVGNATQAFQSGLQHLTDALDHIAREYQQAMSDKAAAEASLADAQRRVDEMQAAALHIAGVGSGVEKLLGVAQEVSSSQSPVEEAIKDAPAAIQEVEQIVTEGQSAAASAHAAVAANEPAPAHE